MDDEEIQYDPVPIEESLSPGEEVVNDTPAGEKLVTPEDPAAEQADEAAATESASNETSSEEAPKGDFTTDGSGAADSGAPGTGDNVMSSVNAVRSSPSLKVQRGQKSNDDWRIRLSLAKSANYLYADPSIAPSDLLYPLAATDGVIFPYMPTINTNYRATYSPSDLVHSNYKMHFYQNSSVDDIQIVADFTAQDTAEANYMLAVIHFFKSVTKMFYGQDGRTNGPRAGTPPPLCYLTGLGAYQFNDHPVLITNFTYNLPNDVDYIRAGFTFSQGGQPGAARPKQTSGGWNLMSFLRTKASGLTKGAVSNDSASQNYANSEATYVPTKMQITLTMAPVVTRSDISRRFSVADYAKGKLMRGNQNKGRGIW